MILCQRLSLKNLNPVASINFPRGQATDWQETLAMCATNEFIFHIVTCAPIDSIFPVRVDAYKLVFSEVLVVLDPINTNTESRNDIAASGDSAAALPSSVATALFSPVSCSSTTSEPLFSVVKSHAFRDQVPYAFEVVSSKTSSLSIGDIIVSVLDTQGQPIYDADKAFLRLVESRRDTLTVRKRVVHEEVVLAFSIVLQDLSLAGNTVMSSQAAENLTTAGTYLNSLRQSYFFVSGNNLNVFTRVSPLGMQSVTISPCSINSNCFSLVTGCKASVMGSFIIEQRAGSMTSQRLWHSAMCADFINDCIWATGDDWVDRFELGSRLQSIMRPKLRLDHLLSSSSDGEKVPKEVIVEALVFLCANPDLCVEEGKLQSMKALQPLAILLEKEVAAVKSVRNKDTRGAHNNPTVPSSPAHVTAKSPDAQSPFVESIQHLSSPLTPTSLSHEEEQLNRLLEGTFHALSHVKIKSAERTPSIELLAHRIWNALLDIVLDDDLSWTQRHKAAYSLIAHLQSLQSSEDKAHDWIISLLSATVDTSYYHGGLDVTSEGYHILRSCLIENLSFSLSDFNVSLASNPIFFSRLWDTLLTEVDRELLTALPLCFSKNFVASLGPCTQLLVTLFEQEIVYSSLSIDWLIKDPILLALMQHWKNVASSLLLTLRAREKELNSDVRSVIDTLINCSYVGQVLLPWLAQLNLKSNSSISFSHSSHSSVSSNYHLKTASPTIVFSDEVLGVMESLVPLMGSLFGVAGLRRDVINSTIIPSPWHAGITMESVHPVYDGYRYHEICTIKGAKNLYLTFDRRCSSQYEYDRVVISSGSGSSARKVAEYGGNTAGFGSRSVFGKGWPKDIVRVAGDTITVDFEMRSSRESATPDHAMWGFAITIRGQEESELGGVDGFSILLDLCFTFAMHRLYAASSLFHSLSTIDYERCDPTSNRQMTEIQTSLRSTQAIPGNSPCGDGAATTKLPLPFLEDLDWSSKSREVLQALHDKSNVPTNTDSSITQDVSEIAKKSSYPSLNYTGSTHPISAFFRNEQDLFPVSLKATLASIVSPPVFLIRPSVKTALEIEKLELVMLSACMKIMGLSSIEEISPFFLKGNTDKKKELLSLIWEKSQTLLRWLTSMANLENLWDDEVIDIVNASKTVDEAFFVEWHQQDPHMLYRLCDLVGVKYTSKDEATTAVVNLKYALSSAGTTFSSVKPANLVVSDNGSAHQKDAASPAILALSRCKSLADTILGRAGCVLFLLSSSKRPLPWSSACETTASVIQMQSKIVDFFHFLSQRLLGSDRVAMGDVIDAVFQRCVILDEFAAGLKTVQRSISWALECDPRCRQLLVFTVDAAVLAIRRGLQDTGDSRPDDSLQLFSATFDQLVSIIRHDICLCPNALAICGAPFRPWHAPSIAASGLVHLLSETCSSSSSHTLRLLSWNSFRLLALCCASWNDFSENASLDTDTLSLQIGTVLGQRLSHAVALTRRGLNSHGQHPASEALALFNSLSFSLLGRTVVSNSQSIESLLLLLASDTCTPDMMHVIARLLRLALPLLDARVTSENREIFNSYLQPDILLFIFRKLIDLSFPALSFLKKSYLGKRPTHLQPVSNLPFSQNFHEHVLTLTPAPYADRKHSLQPEDKENSGNSLQELGFIIEGEAEQKKDLKNMWTCDKCTLNRSDASYHCHLCEVDFCIDCYEQFFEESHLSIQTLETERFRASASKGQASGLNFSCLTHLTATEKETAVPGHLDCGHSVSEGIAGDDNDGSMYVVYLHCREGQSAQDVLQPLMDILMSIDDCEAEEGEGDDGSGLLSRLDMELSESKSSIAFRGPLHACDEFSKDCSELGVITSIELDDDDDDEEEEEEEEEEQNKEAGLNFGEDVKKQKFKTTAEDHICKNLNHTLANVAKAKQFFITSEVANTLSSEFIWLLQYLVSTKRMLGTASSFPGPSTKISVTASEVPESVISPSYISWQQSTRAFLKNFLNVIPSLVDKKNRHQRLSISDQWHLAGALVSLNVLCFHQGLHNNAAVEVKTPGCQVASRATIVQYYTAIGQVCVQFMSSGMQATYPAEYVRPLSQPPLLIDIQEFDEPLIKALSSLMNLYLHTLKSYENQEEKLGRDGDRGLNAYGFDDIDDYGGEESEDVDDDEEDEEEKGYGDEEEAGCDPNINLDTTNLIVAKPYGEDGMHLSVRNSFVFKRLLTQTLYIWLRRLDDESCVKDTAKLLKELVPNLCEFAQMNVFLPVLGLESCCDFYRNLLLDERRPHLPTLNEVLDTTSISLPFNVQQVYPPLSGIRFTNNFTDVLLASNKGVKLADGVILYSESSIASNSPSVYFEMKIHKMYGISSKSGAALFLHPSHAHPLVEAVTTASSHRRACDVRSASKEIGGCGREENLPAGEPRFECIEGCTFSICGDCCHKGCLCPLAVGLGPMPKPSSVSVRKGHGNGSVDDGSSGIPSDNASKRGYIWPANSVLFQSDGLVWHKESGIVEKKSSEVNFGPQDVIGVLWQPQLNTITFVKDNIRVLHSFSSTVDANSSTAPSIAVPLHLVLQLRLNDTRVSFNFGEQVFVYKNVGSSSPREEESESAKAEAASIIFDALPFAGDLMEGGVEETTVEKDDKGSSLEKKSILEHKLSVSPLVAKIVLPPVFSNMVGPSAIPSSEDVVEEDDNPTRLVKAWETLVFPKINSRFRNNSERKSGLDQIRGALMYGMPDVARLTVEGLYEESGGLPADLHLPTVEDLKASVPKLGANQLQRGLRVRINNGNPARTGYEVRGMEGTRSSVGTVISIDSTKGLALVSVYVEREGLFECWWFPCTVLERASANGEGELMAGTLRNIDYRQRLCIWERRLAYGYAVQCLIKLANCTSASVDGSGKTLPATDSTNDDSIFIPLDNFITFYSLASMKGPELYRSAFAYLDEDAMYAIGVDKTILTQALSRHLVGMDKSDLKEFIQDLWFRIVDDACYSELQVTPGKKTETIKFSTPNWVVVTCRPKDDTQPIVQKLSSAKTNPWFSAFISCCEQTTLVGSYPLSASCETGLPFLLVPASKILARTTGKDNNNPNATIIAFSCSLELPVFLLTVREILCNNDVKLTSDALTLIAEVVLSLLVVGFMSPPMRVTLLHVFASVVRATPNPIPNLQSYLDTLKVELALAAPTRTLHSSYIHALVEVIVASCDKLSLDKKNNSLSLPVSVDTMMVKESVSNDALKQMHRTDDAISDMVATAASFSSPGLEPPMPTAAASPILEIKDKSTTATLKNSVPVKEKDVVKSLCSVVETLRCVCLQELDNEMDTSGTMSNRLPQVPDFLIDMTFRSLNPSSVYHSIVIVTGIQDTQHLEETRSQLFLVAQRFGGASKENVLVGAGRGAEAWAVVCLDVSVRRMEFVAAIKLMPQLREARVDFGDILEKADKNGELSSAAFDYFIVHQLRYAVAVKRAIVEQLIPFVAELGPFTLLSNGEQLCTGLSEVTLKDISITQVLHRATMLIEAWGGNTDAFKSFYDTPSVIMPSSSEEMARTIDSVLEILITIASDNPRSFFRKMVETGYDGRFLCWKPGDRTFAARLMAQWTHEMDVQLVRYVNERCHSSSIHSSRLIPQEFNLRELDAARSSYSLLVSVPVISFRLRLAALYEVNSMVFDEIFMFDLHHLYHHNSIAALLSSARRLLFYDSKIDWLNTILNESAQRTSPTGPEITLDPLQSMGRFVDPSSSSTIDSAKSGSRDNSVVNVVGIYDGSGDKIATVGVNDSVEDDVHTPAYAPTLQYITALKQIMLFDPALLRVRLPAGGDPIFPLVVRLSGETVQGTSGSFREFLLYMCKDLQSSALHLLTECPSAATGRNVGRYMLKTGPVTSEEEKLLEFFGMLIGISLRSDVPLSLDLLPSFWKCLVGEPLSNVDLDDGDRVIGDLLRQLSGLPNEDVFVEFMAVHKVSTLVRTLDSRDISLSYSHGKKIVSIGNTSSTTPDERLLTWTDVPHFVRELQHLRLQEFSNPVRFSAIRRGLASIIPVDILAIFSWQVNFFCISMVISLNQPV